MPDQAQPYLLALLQEKASIEEEISREEKCYEAARHILACSLEHLTTKINNLGLGLDQSYIDLAETVLYVRGAYATAGQDKAKQVQSAIDYLAFGKTRGFYDNLRNQYFATKNYEHWRGQAVNCYYGMVPRHGGVIFEIGLTPDARRRDLTEAEREAAVYYLLHLEQIQQPKAEPTP